MLSVSSETVETVHKPLSTRFSLHRGGARHAPGAKRPGSWGREALRSSLEGAGGAVLPATSQLCNSGHARAHEKGPQILGIWKESMD